MTDQHPTHAEPEPPFPAQEQSPPGRESDMRPLADHGEDTYRGSGRLEGRKAWTETALYAGDRLLARAAAVWIAVDPAAVAPL